MSDIKVFKIYVIRNRVNRKVYVGQTCQKLNRRWNNGNGYKGSKHFTDAIRKYGPDSFYYEVLELCYDAKEADELEILYIQKLKANVRGYGYNKGPGGKSPMLGRKHSAISKAKISRNHRDIRGDKNPMWGKKLSEEHKQKLVRSLIGVKPWNTGMTNPYSE